MSFNQVKVKILDKDTSSYHKLSSIIPEVKDIVFKSKPSDSLLLRNYYRACFRNKKQPQHTNKSSGRKKVTHPAGTNKGQSRQPVARISNMGLVVSNVPNARKGGKAMPFSINQSNINLNRKQKTAAIRYLITLLLKKSPVYVLNNNEKSFDKTSHFLTYIAENSNKPLNNYLNDHVRKVKSNKKDLKRGPVLIMEDHEPVLGYFRNLSNCQLINKTKVNYFGIYKGFRLPHSVFCTKEALQNLIKKIYHV
jgi:ribosomal protein L4